MTKETKGVKGDTPAVMEPLRPCHSVESKLWPGHKLDGAVHYIRLVWEERKRALEHCDQQFVDMIDEYLAGVEARL